MPLNKETKQKKQYLKPFNCVQIKLLVLVKYLKVFNVVQTNERWLALKCYLQTIHLKIIYDICIKKILH